MPNFKQFLPILAKKHDILTANYNYNYFITHFTALPQALKQCFKKYKSEPRSGDLKTLKRKQPIKQFLSNIKNSPAF